MTRTSHSQIPSQHPCGLPSLNLIWTNRHPPQSARDRHKPLVTPPAIVDRDTKHLLLAAAVDRHSQARNTLLRLGTDIADVRLDIALGTSYQTRHPQLPQRRNRLRPKESSRCHASPAFVTERVSMGKFFWQAVTRTRLCAARARGVGSGAPTVISICTQRVQMGHTPPLCWCWPRILWSKRS